MDHELLQVARAFVAAVAVLTGVLLPGGAPAHAREARDAAAQARIRLILAAPHRGSAYFAREKAMRPGSCAVSMAGGATFAAQPVPRANKSRLRSMPQWGLQRLARRGAKQSAAATRTATHEVIDELRQVMRLVRRGEARSGRAVSAAAQRAIACVESSPGIQVSALARNLGIHQSTASNLVEKLGREGLVAKRRTVEDYRTVKLFATTKGREALRDAPSQGADRLQEALARLPASTRAALSLHLRALREQLQPGDVQPA